MSNPDPRSAHSELPTSAPALAAARSGSAQDLEATFEELMEQLEALTARLAAGDVGIEATADLYERAERLHAQAKERLDQVRARVESLVSPVGTANNPSGASPPRGQVRGEDGV